MEKINKVLWGVFFIVIGVIIGTNALGITNINMFFKGWWTLIIIVPCFVGLFSNENEGKIGNLVGILIGVGLLLSANGLISFDLIMKMILPLILVAIGLSLIFNETIKSKVSKKVKEGRKNGLENIVATFAEQKINKDNEEFTGANLDAVFGAVNLDICKANIEKEAVIKASAIFGGVQIIVPTNVNVKVKSTPIFGGVSNKTINKKENEKVIYVDAFCMFGGVDIK